MSLNIVSLNVRGLKDPNKRRTVFDYYRGRCDILCLQETHSEEKDEKIWQNEWGGKIAYSHGTHQSRGVATLINRQFKYKNDTVYTGQDGRAVVTRICINDVIICVNNIYAPNQDCPSFFYDEIMRVYNLSENVIIIGDYNMVLDCAVDKNSVNTQSNNENAAKQIRTLMKDLYLEEAWRTRNPETKRFSWYRTIKKANKRIL